MTDVGTWLELFPSYCIIGSHGAALLVLWPLMTCSPECSLSVS